MILLVSVSLLLLLCSVGSMILFFMTKGIDKVVIATTAPPISGGNQVLPVNNGQVSPTQVIIPPSPTTAPLPDPAGFIYSYYNYLNDRDYASAWSCLSENFIVKIGNKAGHPYDFTNDYVAYWNTVARIDVLEASLESLDSRSAAVLLKLRWNMFSGASPVYNHRFYLIKHPYANSWLIDVTETWE